MIIDVYATTMEKPNSRSIPAWMSVGRSQIFRNINLFKYCVAQQIFVLFICFHKKTHFIVFISSLLVLNIIPVPLKSKDLV